MQIISPFASQMLDEMNGTRGGKGLRLVLRTAKMLGTKEWLQSGHLVPGATDFRFASVPPQGSGVGKLSEARPSGRGRGRSAESLQFSSPAPPTRTPP